MTQTTFTQRVKVYSVKAVGGKQVEVRAEGMTRIGRMSIFFPLSLIHETPRVGEDILIEITIPADSAPAVSE